jgi:hypothetical protein
MCLGIPTALVTPALPACRYEAVQPLYRSWQQYMRELLAQGGQDVETRLYAADLHGCLMRVAATQGVAWPKPASCCCKPLAA